MRFRNFPFDILSILLPGLFLGFGNLVLCAQHTLNPNFDKEVASLLSGHIPTIDCYMLNLQKSAANLYLLDAREMAEYEVSHLAGAVYVGSDDFKPDRISAIPRDAMLVVYCSIGYRSEKIAEKLDAMGFSKVYNLYGGIFEWSNRGYPLVDKNGQKTTKLHAFNKDWGRWIERGAKVY